MRKGLTTLFGPMDIGETSNGTNDYNYAIIASNITFPHIRTNFVTSNTRAHLDNLFDESTH